MTTPQAQISTLLEQRSEAMRLKDIERLMSLYSSDIVYFDLVPPLRYVGAAALRGRFEHWFTGWKSGIGMEMRDLYVSANDEVASAWMLLRASGTLSDGREVGYWVRTSNCCRRSAQGWLITHEHVSLPVDMKTRSAVVDLLP